jgi:hypothetical protein
MDKKNNKYNPPDLNENKSKIEPFDIIETKQRKPIIPNIPSVQKIIKNQSNNNNNKEENTLNNEYSSIPINEDNFKNNNNNMNNINKQEDFINTVQESIKKFLENKTVSIIINPFQNSSEGVQLCYKIYSAITIFIILLVIILSITFT